MDFSQFASNTTSRKDFEFLGKIGIIPYGRLEKAKHIRDNKEFAIKIFEKSQISSPEIFSKIVREKEVLSRVKSPGFVPLHSTFIDAENIYLVLEFCPNGNLLQFIQRFKTFPFELARFYAGELVYILEVLRKECIVHSELNLMTLLIGSDYHLYVTGFGDALLPTEASRSKQILNDNPDYLSPEALEGEVGIGNDLWSVGCLIYQMLVGKSPFSTGNSALTIEQIRTGQIEFPSILPPFAVDLIQSLLLSDKASRIGYANIQDLKSHIFFHGLEIDMIYKLPVPDYKHEMTKETAAKSRIIYEGVVKKKAGWIFKKRLLIISEEPKITYYEPTRREYRGEIAISQELRGEVKSKIDFHIITPKRTYFFKTINDTPDKWVKAVAELVRQLYGS